jgi:hypothetical protein
MSFPPPYNTPEERLINIEHAIKDLHKRLGWNQMEKRNWKLLENRLKDIEDSLRFLDEKLTKLEKNK